MRYQNFFKNYAKDNVDAIVVLSPQNRFYFTGVSTSAGAFIATRSGQAYFLTDFRYIELARESSPSGIIVEMVTDLHSSIKQILESHRAKVVGIEGDFISWSIFQSLSKLLVDCVLISVSGELDSLRAIKSDGEIANIKTAQGIAEKTLSKLMPQLKAGITEIDIARELVYIANGLGSSGLSFEPIIAFGKNSSKPHSQPTNAKLTKGDLVLIDFGCKYNGYSSDMTRTFAFYTEPDEKLVKVYDIVLKAQTYALSNLKAGISAKEADSFARELIKANGYGDTFGHGLGHGIGINVHEIPRLSPKSDELLQENMVVSVEPGIYIEGVGGVRIEDMIVIKNEGIENLTTFDKKFKVL